MRTLVCIGFAEALAAPEVTWSLRDAGHDVIAFGRRGRRSPLRHSRVVTVVDVTPPETDYPRTIEELQAVLDRYNCSGYGRCAFFPLDDPSVFLSTRLSLDEPWRLTGPAGDAAEVALDKTRQIKLASRRDSMYPRRPKRTVVRTYSSRAGELPLILRPSHSVAPFSRRLLKGTNWICANQTELDEAVSQWKEAGRFSCSHSSPELGRGSSGSRQRQEFTLGLGIVACG